MVAICRLYVYEMCRKVGWNKVFYIRDKVHVSGVKSQISREAWLPSNRVKLNLFKGYDVPSHCTTFALAKNSAKYCYSTFCSLALLLTRHFCVSSRKTLFASRLTNSYHCLDVPMV